VAVQVLMTYRRVVQAYDARVGNPEVLSLAHGNKDARSGSMRHEPRGLAKMILVASPSLFDDS
jgi:hypothetical protein